jgi:feruloyl esterase
MTIRAACLLLVLAMTMLVPVPAAAASCDSLAALALPHTTITLTQSVAAGAFTPPGGAATPAAAAALQALPAFCRVAATLTPTSDSDIKVEVWLPASGWNGKFQAVGNGGWAGSISYPAMGQALRRGYATASTDTGHTGGRGTFVLGHPEKLVDYSWRSIHEMTVESKAIIAAFYGNAPRLSYWNGCSTGGRQALTEAQRFPNDFDGIIAGAPGNYRTHHAFSQLWAAHVTLKDPAGYIPRPKFEVLHKAAVNACDALDGLKDGLLDDPTRCRFDPQALACKEGDGPACLTAPQVEAARKIYAGPKNPRTGQAIFPPLERGSELGWPSVAAGPEPYQVAVDHFKYVVFQNPNWDWRTLNFDSDVDLSDKRDNGLVNAIDPHLEKFFGHGGKLLMYHGWSDQLIAPQNSINYYKSVADTLGGASKVQSSLRLFLAPGMGHCGNGDGPNVLETVGALEQWVEKGQAPNQILASHSTDGKVDRTRPLCPYPQVAKYKGAGSIDEAANFVCAAPGTAR